MYPWLKGHGSIEGTSRTARPCCLPSPYPWLKGHGSIEGWAWSAQRNQSRARYPWLKGHGSIEGPRCRAGAFPPSWYPWLKGHGSIEGAEFGFDGGPPVHAGIGCRGAPRVMPLRFRGRQGRPGWAGQSRAGLGQAGWWCGWVGARLSGWSGFLLQGVYEGGQFGGGHLGGFVGAAVGVGVVESGWVDTAVALLSGSAAWWRAQEGAAGLEVALHESCDLLG